MLNRTCAIYDNNQNYARRLMNAMSRKANQQFNIELFTQRDAFERYLSEDEPAVAMVSEAGYFDELRDVYSGNLIVLTEEQQQDNLQFGDNAVAVYRYQPMDIIYREVLEHSDLRPKGRLDTIDIIGVYSPVNVLPKTAFSLNVAKVLSERYKVLYINFEEFSGLDEILCARDDVTLSDALYYFRQGKQAAKDKILKTIQTVEGVDYIPPVMCAEDISYIESEEMAAFVECAGKGGHYETVVLDLSSALRQPWRVMVCCTSIFMPIKNDYLWERKIFEFETYFCSIGLAKVLGLIEKVRLPEGESGIDTDFWNKIKIGGMYRFVKKILEKNNI